jgi:formylglycine-generating enzyme required for sulfatase activity
MSDFDPYHQWLGIPETERPISKYRLLALVDFEADRGVISAAVEQRTIYLRTMQAGEHEVLVAELLNEVSQARVTLLNADQKAEYDEELRKQQTPEPEAKPTPPPIPVVQPPTPIPVVVRGTVTQEFPVSVVQSAKRPRRRRQKEIWKRPAVIGAAVVGVISVFVLVINLMFSGDAEPVASNTPPVATPPLIPTLEPEPTPLPETETQPEPPLEPAQATVTSLPLSLQEGLIAYYPLDGTSSQNKVSEESKSTWIVGGQQATFDRFGNPTGATTCGEGNGYLALFGQDRGKLALRAFTISTWLKWKNNHPTDDYRVLISRGTSPNQDNTNYQLHVFNLGDADYAGKLAAVVGGGNERGKLLTSDTVVADGKWHHTAFVVNATLSNCTLYIDGKKERQTNVTDVWVRKEQYTTVGVGAPNAKGLGYGHFNGLLDDLRIYKRPLSHLEVKVLYEYESKPPASSIPTPPAIESTTNTFGMTFNMIPAGTFMMGSPESEADRQDIETQHPVTISKAFYMHTTEVTQGQWKEVMGTEPWKGKLFVKEGSNYPATYVSWHDAVAYCKKLSEKEGKTYRLPTEAEWEYACRAGTTTTWSFGGDEKELGDYAWYRDNAYDIDEKYAHQVELKKPNAFGLYDMHGNVYEWCHDYFEEDYYKQSPAKDPTGPTSGSFRVFRGGSWVNYTRSRSAHRGGYGAVNRYYYGGFRLVRELDSKEKAAAAAAALAKGDWKQALALDPDNSQGLRLKATAITNAIAKGHWETVLALDATNSNGLRMKTVAITAAITKGDWKTLLELDATNSDGLRLRAAAEKATNLAGDPITNTIGMTLNKIPAGTFTMGSPEDEEGRRDNEHQHPVTISKAFYMQTTEVTQGQWKAMMGTEPWIEFNNEGKKEIVKIGDNFPAVYVSWNNTVAYCKKLSEKEGKTYRLPTEAEWEYACRAGTKTTWSFGDDKALLEKHAWYRENTSSVDEQGAHPVGQKKPNAFGLYDMHGNVWEWCHDYFGEDYYNQSPETDPPGPKTGPQRIVRGASWAGYLYETRSAFRLPAKQQTIPSQAAVGFRLVRELD